MNSGSRELDQRIASKSDLLAYLESGCKPRDRWRIGTEHEKFGFDLSSLAPLTYDGKPGIRELLEGLSRFGWKPSYEGGNVIAMSLEGQSITLEPGGQVELSGAPLESIHETCNEVNNHLAQVKEVATEIGAGFIGLGFHPKFGRADMPLMPKGRYDLMVKYMPKKGGHGLDMMLRSCTVQANLDFESEADMVKKFRVALSLQPVATALFANSPFVDGKPSGYLSYRSFVWTDTDPDRCGILPFVFEQGMSFERYVDYALDVPMYFVHRDATYIDATGLSFRDFLDGNLSILPGQKPTMQDWEDHLTTLFPEVRMKRFLEMRGADGGPWARLCALPAFWAGILYDTVALDAAWDLCCDFTPEEHSHLRSEVPRLGLATPFRPGKTVRDLAGIVLEIARSGLKARARYDSAGNDESGFLDTLFTTYHDAKSPAELLLDHYNTDWGQSVNPAFVGEAY